jgi:hypothetical protein
MTAELTEWITAAGLRAERVLLRRLSSGHGLPLGLEFPPLAFDPVRAPR